MSDLHVILHRTSICLLKNHIRINRDHLYNFSCVTLTMQLQRSFPNNSQQNEHDSDRQHHQMSWCVVATINKLVIKIVY